MTKPRLLTNIEKIAAYTGEHAGLKKAHHFLYDVRRPPDREPEYVVMGINPGETASDWANHPEPTEETSRRDFHQGIMSRSAASWARHARFFLDEAPHVLAELFLWSSKDGKQFRERFGPLAASPHLAFCTDMNRDLIDAYAPKAVIVVGIGMTGLCQAQYGLTHQETFPAAKGRLVERYTDGQRPWLITRHWTASFGFSNEMRERTREYIRAHS